MSGVLRVSCRPEGAGFAAGLELDRAGVRRTVRTGLDLLKDKPSASTHDTIRDLEIKESYEGGGIVANTVVLGLTMTPSAQNAERDGPAAQRPGIGWSPTYITYMFKDSPTAICYVGRASRIGTPEQVLYKRLLKGHHVFLANESVYAEVHGNRAASMGADGVYYDYTKETGHQLLNTDPPPSDLPGKGGENAEADRGVLRGLVAARQASVGQLEEGAIIPRAL